MRRVLLLAAVLALLGAGSAQGAGFNPRLELLYRVATVYWGGPPEGCTEVTREIVPDDSLGPAVEARASQPLPGAPPAPCLLLIEESSARTDLKENHFLDTCEIIVHESGHLHGEAHSDDPENIMYPQIAGSYALPICFRLSERLERASALRGEARWMANSCSPSSVCRARAGQTASRARALMALFWAGL